MPVERAGLPLSVTQVDGAELRFRGVWLAIFLVLLTSLVLYGQTAVPPAPPTPETSAPVVSPSPPPSESQEQPKPAAETKPASEAAAPTVVVEGKVRSGNTPVPGATVTATNTKTGQKFNTWTQTDGSFKLSLSSGDYSVRVQMVAFAAATQQVHVAGGAHHQIDFHITLLSRAETTGAGAYARAGGAAGGFQSLSVVAGEGGNSSGAEGNESVAPSGMPVPGVPPSVSTESVAVSGSSSATNMFGMSTD
ncbi:MAG: carboxypeptidase-like regulatory domain-containing protein, partial [Candidatus Korobacteraceae bacterium]